MLLKELTEAIGVSGREDQVRQIIRQALEGKVKELRTDALGNLITRQEPAGRLAKEHPRVMITAHMDEVGLMISSIDRNGLLRFRPVGAIDERVLPSKVVRVGRDGIPGVIGLKPIHLQEGEERRRVVKTREMFIDIGVKDKEAAEKLVKPGDLATFATAYEEMGTGLAKGKAIDDRVGCAALVEIMSRSYAFPVYGVFTVQEEVGLRGATVVAYELEPDLAVVLEGTAASDVPDTPDHLRSTVVGEGPALTVMDRTVIAHQPSLRRLEKVAERHRIPIQMKRLPVGGTEAGKIHLSRGGVPTVVISVPCRYIHSPVGVFSLADWRGMIDLVYHFLESIAEEGLPR